MKKLTLFILSLCSFMTVSTFAQVPRPLPAVGNSSGGGMPPRLCPPHTLTFEYQCSTKIYGGEEKGPWGYTTSQTTVASSDLSSQYNGVAISPDLAKANWVTYGTQPLPTQLNSFHLFFKLESGCATGPDADAVYLEGGIEQDSLYIYFTGEGHVSDGRDVKLRGQLFRNRSAILNIETVCKKTK